MVEVSAVNKICDMYGRGCSLRSICEESSIGLTAVQRVLVRAADTGDVRVLRRRQLRGEKRLAAVLDAIQADGGASAEQIAVVLYLAVRPAQWRIVVKMAVTALRKRGHVITLRDNVYVHEGMRSDAAQ